jgi:hypothetical protein
METLKSPRPGRGHPLVRHTAGADAVIGAPFYRFFVAAVVFISETVQPSCQITIYVDLLPKEAKQFPGIISMLITWLLARNWCQNALTKRCPCQLTVTTSGWEDRKRGFRPKSPQRCAACLNHGCRSVTRMKRDSITARVRPIGSLPFRVRCHCQWGTHERAVWTRGFDSGGQPFFQRDSSSLPPWRLSPESFFGASL